MERLEDRIARTGFLRAGRHRARPGVRLHSSPREPSRNRLGGFTLGVDNSLYRGSRRIILSRVGTESARTQSWTPSGFSGCIRDLRSFAFQQASERAHAPLQLALRFAGDDCGHFLWPCLAGESPRAGFDDYTCERRLAVGIVVLKVKSCQGWGCAGWYLRYPSPTLR